jgi:hypothetical protein
MQRVRLDQSWRVEQAGLHRGTSLALRDAFKLNLAH